MKVKNLIALALTTAALLSGCAGTDVPETQTVPSTEQVQTEPVQTTGAPEAAKLDLACTALPSIQTAACSEPTKPTTAEACSR